MLLIQSLQGCCCNKNSQNRREHCHPLIWGRGLSSNRLFVMRKFCIASTTTCQQDKQSKPFGTFLASCRADGRPD